MSNHIEWIDINTTEDALSWFEQGENEQHKNDYREQVTDTVFDRDSSPKAWEHYNSKYQIELIERVLQWLKTPEKRAPNKFSKNDPKDRITGILNIDRITGFSNANESNNNPPSIKFGGDCDFNFKNIGSKAKSKFEIFADYLWGEDAAKKFINKESQEEEKYIATIDDIKFEKTINDEPFSSEFPKKDIEIKTKQLLKKCCSMLHTLLNFSLMPVTGGLNNFKGSLCDYDRLDRFVFFLDQYYKTPMCDQRNTPIVINAEIANRSCLVHYLNQFSKDSNNKEIPADKCIYNYCAKIYFLPTKDFPTGMMTKIEEEKKATFNSTEWENLFKNNKKLIDDLVKWGAKDFKEKTEKYQKDNRELTENYMLLAVRFWQAKEFYFNLIDEANEASKQTKKEILMVDDSVDVGKHPLPINNPEAQKIHDEFIKKYGTKNK